MIRPGVVAAIVRKDVAEFARDRFFVLMTLLALIVYPLFYWVLPGDVNETIRIGVTSTVGVTDVVAPDTSAAGGIEIVTYPDAATLETAVLDGSDGIVAGMAFPEGFIAAVGAGEPTRVELLLTADVPPEVRGMMSGIVSELAFAIAGEPPPVNPVTDAIVLGTDRVGDQISFREQLRPLLAFFVLMVETFALASLVAIEVQQRTVTAVLVTPATAGDFITAKIILGTTIAFTEAVVIVALIGGFATGAPMMAAVLLLGAVLVTAFGMVAGAFGKDFIGVLFLSMLLMIPLMIPGFAALFPGAAAGWVQALPSYGLVESIVRITTESAGWATVAPALAMLGAWCLAAAVVGAVVLKRRVATL